MGALRVAVSARSLFDLDESTKVFAERGVEAFIAHTRENQETPFQPGVAFPLVRGLLNLNQFTADGSSPVEIVVVTSFNPEAGLRLLKSIDHHGLPIKRAIFTGGAPTIKYLEALGVNLLLSKSPEDAQAAIHAGIAAAIMYNPPKSEELDNDPQIRIAFDGDAVIFSDESERVYKTHGLPAFVANERDKVNEPLPAGPFEPVLRAICEIQKNAAPGRKPFRIALVTARGGFARERVLRTFQSWDVDFDEAHFLDGFSKAGILRAFRPHIFFDDQDTHVLAASEVVPSGRVPYVTPLVESLQPKSAGPSGRPPKPRASRPAASRKRRAA